MQEYWKLHPLLTTSYLLQATLIWNIIFRLHHACSHPSGQLCSIQILLISGVCFFVFSFFCVSPSFFFQFMYRMPSSWNDRPICLQIFNIGVNLNNNEIIFMVMTIQFVFSINDKIYVCCIFFLYISRLRHHNIFRNGYIEDINFWGFSENHSFRDT